MSSAAGFYFVTSHHQPHVVLLAQTIRVDELRRLQRQLGELLDGGRQCGGQQDGLHGLAHLLVQETQEVAELLIEAHVQ